MGTQSVAEARTPDPTRTPSILRITAPLAVGIPIMLLVVASLGGLSESDIPGLPVVPLATLVSLPIDIWIRDIAMALTVGGAIVGGVLAPRPDARIGRLTSCAALVWLAALAIQAVLTVSEVLAMPLRSAFDPTIMWSLLTQTTLGRVILIQFALVALVAVLGWVVLDRVTGMIIVLAAGTSAFLLGFTGHSGISDGHAAATISLGLHVVAATAWIGGLIATIAFVAAGASGRPVVLRRFSVLALICVILLAESGLLNASLRMDGPAALITSPYGAIITAKVCVLIVLIGFGWRQRTRVIDRMTDESRTRSLVQLGAWEIAWMGIVLGLSVALARTAPPAGVVSGDAMSFASVVLLGLGIPLALTSATARQGPRILRSYPEAVAVLAVAAMFAFPTAMQSQIAGPQVIAILALVTLPVLGWLFFTSVGTSITALCIVAVSVPVLAWWAERGIVGGLTWSTWMIAGLGIAMVTLVAIRRRAVPAPTARDSDKVSA
ncbi:MAG: copper resistance D family protein [Candidatus Nanopelagicales bacterium]